MFKIKIGWSVKLKNGFQGFLFSNIRKHMAKLSQNYLPEQINQFIRISQSPDLIPK